jgi:hypothetical protein
MLWNGLRWERRIGFVEGHLRCTGELATAHGKILDRIKSRANYDVSIIMKHAKVCLKESFL